MFRPTITDMQDKYCGDRYDIYRIQSRYKGNHKRGGAAEVLRAWFIAPPTAMNPNLQYAAYFPGVSNGSAVGEIATTFRWSSKVTDSAALLAGSAHWSAADAGVMARWNAADLEWLLRRADSGGTAARCLPLLILIE